MTRHVDFYFDFSSPYGYLGATQIADIEEQTGCTVSWRPYLMATAYKLTGRQPLVGVPLIRDYASNDVQRSARLLGVEFNWPSTFPILTSRTARAFYWLHDRNPDLAKQFTLNAYHRFFVDDKNHNANDTLTQLIDDCGQPSTECVEFCNAREGKARLRSENDAALARKVFGSPYFITDDKEPFWGVDRIDQLKSWLNLGKW